mmetsp:Transcript_41370/g.92533  ORF Transcript_41370/g.92533 Transcript_41370/m.92533 type:complete len:137 (-) Transcript_41370:1112-1522(-)
MLSDCKDWAVDRQDRCCLWSTARPFCHSAQRTFILLILRELHERAPHHNSVLDWFQAVKVEMLPPHENCMAKHFLMFIWGSTLNRQKPRTLDSATEDHNPVYSWPRLNSFTNRSGAKRGSTSSCKLGAVDPPFARR